jgi:hypothetical protein
MIQRQGLEPRRMGRKPKSKIVNAGPQWVLERVLDSGCKVAFGWSEDAYEGLWVVTGANRHQINQAVADPVTNRN